MLNCREATRLISRSLDDRLPFSERIAVRIHLLACKACTRYRAHLRFLRSLVRERMMDVDRGGGIAGLAIPPSARERIRNAIAGRGNPPE